MNDLDLQDLVLEELEFKSDINAASIGVTVQDGVVTLSGHVNSYAQKARADAVDIKRQIEDALKRSAEIQAVGIRATVNGGVVKLEGKVHLLREREVVERAVWSVPGVSKVEDNLLIA